MQSASWMAPDTAWGEPDIRLLILALFNRAKHRGWNDGAKADMDAVRSNATCIGLDFKP